MPIADFKTDFLIIGGGIAGLRAAIGASRFGKVTILNKGLKGESSSEFAQGGIAAALNEEPAEIQSHFEDTLIAGRGLCREDAVRVLVSEGPRRIQELLDWGVNFDKNGDRFILAREGAHSKSRILRARGDATGNEIVKTLQRAIASNKNITILNGHFTISLLVSKSQGRPDFCYGALALDEKEHCLRRFFAKAVVLATGGIGQIFRRTTNPPVATGDGIAMALKAGAELEDMEFFQFHPTALALPNAPSFLLSEAIRGEGGQLRNADGKRFMDRYHPDAELAPRDLVSRAIISEIQVTGEDHVFLDVTHLDPHFVRERFPMIYATCLYYGIDMVKQAIPVAPSAHYMMGGVKTDLFGKTNVPRLYAVGEVASTGVHGANRLASNSLLEGLVFGARLGDALEAETSHLSDEADLSENITIGNAGTLLKKSDDEYRATQQELKSVMWNDVGIVRCEPALSNAIKAWRHCSSVLNHPPLSRLALETGNMLWASAALIESARQRRESLGAHFREDFPETQQDRPPEHSRVNYEILKRNFPVDTV